MKYFLSGTWVNDDTIDNLPVGARLLSETEWENRHPPMGPYNWRTPAWARFSSLREDYLNRLTGIAGRATRKGDVTIAAAADAFAEGLLDLPAHASVQPAATPTELSLLLAIKTRYKELAAVAKAVHGAGAMFDKVDL